MQGDVIELETYVHYTRGKAKTWQKVGAAAAGLVIGSLPYLLDRGQNLEGSPDGSLLKTVAPLAGAGVATLPFVLDQRRGKPVGRNHSVPKAKNGWLVPNAYLKYSIYDQEGVLIKSETRIIDRGAKDSWQRLALREEVVQDGFVQIELGNASKRAVWIDGLKYTNQRISRKLYDIQEKLELPKNAPSGIDTSFIIPGSPDLVENGRITGLLEMYRDMH